MAQFLTPHKVVLMPAQTSSGQVALSAHPIWELRADSLSKVFSVQGRPTSQDGADYYLLRISLCCFSAGPYRLAASFVGSAFFPCDRV